MRSTIELGILRWISENCADERSVQARALDPADPAVLQQFLALTGTTFDEVHELGEQAQRVGCATKITDKKMRSTYPGPVMLLRSVKAGWSLTDGTAATTPDDERSRYAVGAPYRNNSCAIDVCLFAGVFLGVGRARGDQIPFSTASELPMPAFLLRTITSTRWGEMSSAERGKLRDVLRQSLTEYDGATFPVGRFLPILDVFKCLLTGSPLLSSTTVRGYECCDGRAYVPDAVRIQRQVVFELPFLNNTSIQGALRSLFGPGKYPGYMEPCRAQCTRTPTGRLLVLDRLPPILAIGCADMLRNVIRGGGDERGLDDISLEYRSPARLDMSDPAISLHDLDLLDPDALRVFRQTAEVPLDEITRLGERADQLGSLRQVGQVTLRLTARREISVLPDIAPRSRWDHIDGTMVQTPRDSARRYTTGVRYENHSCGIDTFLFIAIAIDAGRIRADQITMEMELRLPAPARLLRLVVGREWGTLNPDHHSRLRELLRHSLHAHDATSFPIGEHHEHIDLLTAMFSGLPQLIFTAGIGYSCCDNRLRVPKEALPHTTLGLKLALEDPRQSVQDGLNEMLARRKAEGFYGKPCTNGERCTQDVLERILVLDRLPPVLPVICTASLRDGLRAKVFEDIDLGYQKYKREAVVSYRVLGVLLFQPARRHSYARWRFGERVFQYDGMVDNGQATKVMDWISGLELDKNMIRLVFYQRKE